MSTSPVRVLYLTGTTRSGSTVIGTLLGLVPGLVHVGELAQIWDEGFVRNFRCGCGQPFRDCDLWKRVTAAAFGDREVDAQRLLDLAARWARTRRALRLATARGRSEVRRGMEEHTDAMARLYRAVSQETGSRIVVDSSKTPIMAWLAAGHPEVALSILHVTRDPRAVAYSWRRRKFDPAKGHDMSREGTLKTSLAWLAWNGMAAALWDRSGSEQRYLHVRYEDFAANPRAGLDHILGWLGEESQGARLIGDDGGYQARPGHSIAGNPMRFKSGRSRVVLDTEWSTAASRWDRLLVTGVTWPLLSRYRYPMISATAGHPGG